MELLEKLKNQSYKYTNEKFNELKNTFIEMSVIKSEFDIEKLSIKKQGNFIAHNYHFLIRQYSLAMSELRRNILDKEEKQRQIEEYNNMIKDRKTKIGDKYIDIEIKRLENQIDMIELTIVNKSYSCEYFEKCRLKLIELNNGKEPTNEDYQKEEPDYIKWFLEKQMYFDHVNRQTGIELGVLENINLLEEKPLINLDYQRNVDKKIKLEDFEKKFIEEKNYNTRNEMLKLE